MKKLSSYTRNLVIFAAILLGIAAAGTYMGMYSSAASTFLAIEPETGQKTSGAVQVSDSSASAGASVVFKSALPPTSGITYGWQLTPANTGLSGVGIDRNTLPTFSGQITAGMTISQKKITSTLDLYNIPNVTLDRVWIVPNGGNFALVMGPNTIIKDSDVDGSNMAQGERKGIFADGDPGPYTMQRVSVTKMSIGLWLDGLGPHQGTVSESYIHNLISINGAHMDGFTRRGGLGPLLIDRSRLDTSGPMVTGAFFLQNTWGDSIGGITVKDTMLEGAGWVMTIGNDGPGTSVSMDNVRVRPFGGPGGTSYGPISSVGNVTYPIWNNVRLYDGNRLPDADGAIINRP